MAGGQEAESRGGVGWWSGPQWSREAGLLVSMVVIDQIFFIKGLMEKRRKKTINHTVSEGNVLTKESILVVERMERKYWLEARTCCDRWQSKFPRTMDQGKPWRIEVERSDECSS